MRSTSLVALLACLSTSVACSGPNPDSPSGATNESQVGSPLIVVGPIPLGAECIVATVTGADSETVSATVTAPATTTSIDFGSLGPGAITVTANAYNTACPGVGTPGWVAEPVQATVVAGVATQIPIVLRPLAQGSGAVTFSQAAIGIATAKQTSYAVLADGSVRAWGANDTGQFGFASPTSSATPVVVPGVTNVTQVAAGDGFACALRSDHSMMCWGLDHGEFDGATPGTVTPPVAFPYARASQISAQGQQMGFVVNGSYGEFSDPQNAMFQFLPLPTNPTPTTFIAAGAASGGMAGCWITGQGKAYCVATPTLVLAPIGATQVFTGTETSDRPTSFECALLIDGTVRCAGANAYGELGMGNTTAVTTPTQPIKLPFVSTMALSSGNVGMAHACAVASSGGYVFCMGNNSYGQLGNDTVAASSVYPTAVLGLSNITAIAAGQAHTCALDNEGAVHCWGQNDSGELGDGTIVTRYAPVSVLPW